MLQTLPQPARAPLARALPVLMVLVMALVMREMALVVARWRPAVLLAPTMCCFLCSSTKR